VWNGFAAPLVEGHGSASGSSRLRWILPDRFCMCDHAEHACDKRIRRFEERFVAARSRTEGATDMSSY
jgi:hypothetical protein